jgi:hypothetical protein
MAKILLAIEVENAHIMAPTPTMGKRHDRLRGILIETAGVYRPWPLEE